MCATTCATTLEPADNGQVHWDYLTRNVPSRLANPLVGVSTLANFNGKRQPGQQMPEQPPLAPDERVAAGGEREVLAGILDWHRSVVVNKASGLSEDEVRRRLVPSATTLAGVVKHLTGVERDWFLSVLDRRAAADPPPNGGDGEDSWVLADGETIGSLIEGYQNACEQSRLVAASLSLDRTVPHPRLGRANLRWVYLHMIEETARHVGHMDILRELTDGATGVDG